MPVETTPATIADLNILWPLAADPGSQGDDHIRLIKDALKKTFPNTNAVVTATPAQMNHLVGVTSAIQTQLNALASTKADASAVTTSLAGKVDKTITVTGSNGLSGGGTLDSPRVISATGRLLNIHSIASTGLMVTRSNGDAFTRSVVNGDGISVANGSGDIGNPTVSVDGTVVRTSRDITAGNGLTGGGNLGADRTITLGSPSSITATSTNSVTGTSHTHLLTEGTVRTLIADGTAGGIGTYAFLRRSTLGTAIAAGVVYDSTDLRYSGISTSQENINSDVEGANNTAPPGGANSWRAMGSILGRSGVYPMTLFLRIA